MRDLTKACLERLENAIDEAHVARTRELQKKAAAFEPVDHVPVAVIYGVPEEEWPSYSFQEIFDDREKMLLNELRDVYLGCKLGDDRLFGIRANYGTGIIASAFGCPVHTFEDMLPCAKEVGGIDDIRALVQRGMPDIHGGLCGKALETVAYYREVLSGYPALRRNVGSSLLDIQGTFDNASIIWGSSVFLAPYEEPELLGELMELVTDTICAVILEHRRIDGQSLREDRGAFEYIGGLTLRNDSCINLSGEMYETIVKPCDQRLLGKFTGNIHFCGKAHQWWRRLLDIGGLKAINPYQGEFYDLIDMYRACSAHKVAIFQWTAPVGEEEREAIRTGFSRLAFAQGGFSEAQKLLERLINRRE
jgi:hypothetical protein